MVRAPLLLIFVVMLLLNVDSQVRGGDSNGSRYEGNGLGFTELYCFFCFFLFFLFNVIYFKIELKGGLNRSLDFTSPVYRCSNYTTRTSRKLYR
jgi:hypothetical protein